MKLLDDIIFEICADLLFCFAILGQMGDVETTLYAINRCGLTEGNPLMAPLVKFPSVITGLKLAVTINAYRYAIRYKFLPMLFFVGAIGWGATIWNFNQILRKRSLEC